MSAVPVEINTQIKACPRLVHVRPAAAGADYPIVTFVSDCPLPGGHDGKCVPVDPTPLPAGTFGWEVGPR